MRIGITGHRGLNAEVEREVRALLAVQVAKYADADLIGISCIADGPDTWFAEIVLQHGGRIEVVVPAADYRDSLPAWHHGDYDRLIDQAAEVHETGLDESTSEAHMAGSEVLVGLADELLAVWDGQPARGYGGTADVVTYAERNGLPVRILWPAEAVR
ncbi:hypothetical protein ACFRKE_00610 [Kitasatospora indigofera]|uniref:hypothetical protein n=1 Tax=Kitasatospora indigofera TaxID=67307 RepID=UPI00368FFB9A